MDELSTETTGQRYWLAFTGKTPEAEARSAFRARYGQEPQFVGTSHGNVLAGPVPTGGLR